MGKSSGKRYFVKKTPTVLEGEGGDFHCSPLTLWTDLLPMLNDLTLSVIGNLYEQGSVQPTAYMEPELIRRVNPFMIIKEKYKVNGSQATNIGWVNIGNGEYRWYLKGEQETRDRFNDKRAR